MREPVATILIVDDEASIREMLAQKLGAEGYECAIASGADGALAALAQVRCDLALLDITMPGRSGMDLLAEMQARYPDTAAMMVTAMADTELAIEATKRGAYDYIVKPVSLKELPIRVAGVLGRHRLQAEVQEYQKRLEDMVAERTAQLDQKVRELEQRVREITALNQLFQEHLRQRFEVVEAYREVLAGLEALTRRAELQPLPDLQEVPALRIDSAR